MVTKEQVEQFLNHFHQKIKVFNIFFRDDRGKNTAALAELDITPTYRLEIESLECEDYSQGPILDQLNYYGEMWVFGKDVKGKEVYIKISLGREGQGSICISFHVSEYPMSYPFKHK